MSAISLQNLDISYGDTKVVHGVSLDIAEGESFALVGESGSGKSTILRAIAGLAPDWTGGISILGRARRHGVEREVARQVQMVFQDPYGSLHPRKTIDATLSEPLAINGVGNRGERVEAMLSAVGLDQRFRFRFPHQLSGGQRQRVAIARALVNNPSIILADEPTGNLDTKTSYEIMELFENLHAKGNTIIMVTHEEDIAKYAHRIIRLRDGLIETDEVNTEITIARKAAEGIK